MTRYADAGFWDALAEDYARRPLPNPDATARKLAITRELLRPTDLLLDVGCGTGTIVLELAPHVAEAHGVDISPGMVDIARRKAAAASVENAVFHAREADGLDGFADESFDCVCAYNILHLVEDPTALAAAAFRVLRPGASFVSSTPCLGGRWFPPYALFVRVLGWVGKAPAVTLIHPDELRRALASAGFVDIRAPEVGEDRVNVFLTARRPR